MTKMKKWTRWCFSSNLHSGATNHKSLPKLSIHEHYHQQVEAAEAKHRMQQSASPSTKRNTVNQKTCKDTTKHTKCTPKKVVACTGKRAASQSLSSSSSNSSNNSSLVSLYFLVFSWLLLFLKSFFGLEFQNVDFPCTWSPFWDWNS